MLGVLSHKLFSNTVFKDHKSGEDWYYFHLNKYALEVMSKVTYTTVTLSVVLKLYHFKWLVLFLLLYFL